MFIPPKEDVARDVHHWMKKDKDKSIALISGGFGDFIALDFFLTDEERKSFDVVYQMGYRPHEYKSFFLSYHNIKEYRCFWEFLGSKDTTRDYQQFVLSITKKYSNIRNYMNFNYRSRQYNGSTFMQNSLADLSSFNLPDEYIVICPYTINATEKWIGRRLENSTWKNILSFLESFHKVGIVLGVQCQCPKHPLLINLIDKTSVFEAIEITKNGKFYIGIDSMLSVVAANVMSDKAIVQSKKDIGIAWSNRNYYFPLGVNLVENITIENMKQLMRNNMGMI